MSQFARNLAKEILYKQAEESVKNTIHDSAKIMLEKNLVAQHDRFKLTDPNFLKAVVKNYSKEMQVSMRCPECLIDIPSQEMMKMHAKKHHEQDNKRENEMKVLRTRVHFT